MSNLERGLDGGAYDPIKSFSTRAYAADPNSVPQTVDYVDYSTPSDNLVVSPYTSIDTTRILKLRVLLDDAYSNAYSDYMSEAKASVAYVDYPFINTWRIGFTESFTNIIHLPIDSCSMPDTAYCSDSVCGRNCNNDYSDDVHHKNSVKNLNKIQDYIKDDNYDIFMILTATPLCGVFNGAHCTGILGVTYMGGAYTFITNKPSASINTHVRLMQHEISHMFGCNDGKCASGEKCIMNGGYEGVSLYTKNVWCSNCARDFDVNKH